MSLNKLRDIAKKYLDGEATPEEEQWLHEYYNTVSSDHTETVVTDSATDAEQLGLEIFAELKRKIDVDQPAPVIKQRRLWPRIAVAASVILVLSFSSWFLFFKPSQQTPPENIATVRPTNDLLPGTNGAILTTADGEQIVLDNLQNGKISEEQNTDIIKQNDQLVYDSRLSPLGGQRVVYNTLTTPKGRQFQLVLADGSKVWLNAASSITYPTYFPGNERKVTITGEAYFEVAHDAGKPFKVGKGETEVTVLGTHFNVNAYDDEDEIKVTLLEGSVKVSNTNNSVTIKPGQQAEAIHNSEFITHNSIDLDQVMAWKNGLFSFQEANITGIMRQVARWYDAEVVYEGNVKHEYFSGTAPRSANASVLLKVMETTNTVKINISNGKIIISPVK